MSAYGVSASAASTVIRQTPVIVGRSSWSFAVPLRFRNSARMPGHLGKTSSGKDINKLIGLNQDVSMGVWFEEEGDVVDKLD
jgi:hypothetical protein